MRFFVLVALLGACRVALEDPVDTSAKPACKVLDLEVCDNATGKSDFTFIHANILKRNCTGGSCHQANSTDTKAALLDYSDQATAYASMVQTESRVNPGVNIVEPGQPEKSYLLYIMGAIPADQFGVPVDPPDDKVGFMPRNNGTLCCQKLDAITDWIRMGAQE